MKDTKFLLNFAYAALGAAIVAAGYQGFRSIRAYAQDLPGTFTLIQATHQYDEAGKPLSSRTREVYIQGSSRVERFQDNGLLMVVLQDPRAGRIYRMLPTLGIVSTARTNPVSESQLRARQANNCNGSVRGASIFPEIDLWGREWSSESADGSIRLKTIEWRSPQLGCATVELEETMSREGSEPTLMRRIVTAALSRGAPDGVFEVPASLTETPSGEMRIAMEKAAGRIPFDERIEAEGVREYVRGLNDHYERNRLLYPGQQ